MEQINIITNAISSAITFLENEIQCVEDECLEAINNAGQKEYSKFLFTSIFYNFTTLMIFL